MMARYAAANPVEQTGSLTGHILAHGNSDAPEAKSRTTKVLVVMFLVLLLMVAIGLIAATVASDTITNIFEGILGDG